MNVSVTGITVGVAAIATFGLLTQTGQGTRSKIYFTACDLFHYYTSCITIPFAMKRIVILRDKVADATIQIDVLKDPSEYDQGDKSAWLIRKEKEEFANKFRLISAPITELFDFILSGQMASLLKQVAFLKQENSYPEEVTEFESGLNQLKKDLLGRISNLGLSKIVRMDYSPNKGIQFLYSNIKACSCGLVQKNNRIFFNDNLCQKLSQMAQKINPSITLRSFGSGHCFQELSLHANLTTLGYKVKWILHDPKYKKPDAEESLAAMEFRKILEFFSPDATVKIEANELSGYIEKLEKGEESFSDIMMMVDANSTHNAFYQTITKALKPPHSNILLATIDGREKAKFTFLPALYQ